MHYIMDMNRLPVARQGQLLTMIAEGNSPRATSRMADESGSRPPWKPESAITYGRQTKSLDAQTKEGGQNVSRTHFAGEDQMAKPTGLYGPFVLTEAMVDAQAAQQAAGAYAVGTADASNTSVLHVEYVGRSDDDLNGRLKDHVGTYRAFLYGYFPNARDAFRKECMLYHDFNPRDNVIHPARPKGANYTCPVCGSY